MIYSPSLDPSSSESPCSSPSSGDSSSQLSPSESGYSADGEGEVLTRLAGGERPVCVSKSIADSYRGLGEDN